MNTAKNAIHPSMNRNTPGADRAARALESSSVHAAPQRRQTGRSHASRLLRDTRGANLVEYILVVGLVALIAIVGFKTFGQKVKEKIEGQSTSVSNIQQ